jgi:hypothetical protein
MTERFKALITAEVDYTWFRILDQITRHQEGFVWHEVIQLPKEDMKEGE